MPLSPRLVPVGLLLVLPLVLTGCSGSDDQADETPAATATAEPTTAPDEETTEPTTAPDTGGSAEAVAFCAEGEAATDKMETALSDLDSMSADPTAYAQVLSSAVDELEAVTAPAEIATEWSVMVSTMRTLSDETDTMAAAVVSGDAAAASSYLATLTAVMENPEVAAASEALSVYTSANC